MLDTARPLICDLPGTFADPVALVAGQSRGGHTLVLARYGAVTGTADDGEAAGGTGGDGAHAGREGPSGTAWAEDGSGARWGREGAEGCGRADDALDAESSDAESSDADSPDAESSDYDLFLAADGALVAVARCTPEFRFSIAPARALRRFAEAREAGRAPPLSLYALSPGAARDLLASVLLAPCLKLCVSGAADASLVAAQLRASGCRRGLLEVNSFADPARPRVRLVPLLPVLTGEAPGAPPGSTEGVGIGPLVNDTADDPLVTRLARVLDGFTGRVLVYDTDRNARVAADRGVETRDLDAVAAQGARLCAHVARPVEAALALVADAEAARAEAAAGDERALVAAHAALADVPAVAARDHPAARALAALLADFGVARPAPPLAFDVGRSSALPMPGAADRLEWGGVAWDSPVREGQAREGQAREDDAWRGPSGEGAAWGGASGGDAVVGGDGIPAALAHPRAGATGMPTGAPWEGALAPLPGASPAVASARAEAEASVRAASPVEATWDACLPGANGGWGDPPDAAPTGTTGDGSTASPLALAHHALSEVVAALAARFVDLGGERAFADLDAAARADCDAEADPLAYLDALLTAEPSRRRFGLRTARRRLAREAADALHGWFRAHRESAHPSLAAVPTLWARLST